MPPSLKHPLIKSIQLLNDTPSRRDSFQTSKVEEAHGTMIVIIHILLMISFPVNGMNK